MAFKVPVVEKSCCGCSLETGTKIIGFIHVFLIGGIFLAAFIYHVVIEYKSFKEQHITYFDTFNAAFFRDEFLQMTVFGNLAFSACLLYGTYKRDSVFFEPWLVLKTAVIAFSFFNIGIYLVVRMIGHKVIDIFLQLINVAL
ncbi:uncharacterized protein [Halyomorpha halys]|uniref:uncharacterized protein isoform X2 n=1 Tax=Halyomorpha halys TaxID=286706 RepID=UPI0006D50442|nr:uncharacterized protein LOC106687057 isoform X2 [Halyomorpha halys]